MNEVNEETKTDRVPPHSGEAEESLIGAMLLSSDAVAVAVSAVAATDFYLPVHAQVFEAIKSLHEANSAIDYVTVQAKVQEREGRYLNLAELSALALNTPKAANAAQYAEVVRDRALRRDVIRVGEALVNQGYDTGAGSVAELVSAAERQLEAIRASLHVTPAPQGDDAPVEVRGATAPTPTALPTVTPGTKLTEDELFKIITQSAKGLAEEASWSTYLDLQSRLINFSARNVLAIKEQLPTATELASFGQWQRRGRRVNAGEKGIKVRFSQPNTDKGGYDTVVSTLFDVSQTSGSADSLPLRQTQALQETVARLERFASDVGIVPQTLEADGVETRAAATIGDLAALLIGDTGDVTRDGWAADVAYYLAAKRLGIEMSDVPPTPDTSDVNAVLHGLTTAERAAKSIVAEAERSSRDTTSSGSIRSLDGSLGHRADLDEARVFTSEIEHSVA